jgi:hypothetical protein
MEIKDPRVTVVFACDAWSANFQIVWLEHTWPNFGLICRQLRVIDDDVLWRVPSLKEFNDESWSTS